VAPTARATTTIPWAIAPTRSALVELVVRGRIARTAGPVEVRLQTAAGRSIAVAPIDPTGHGHGAWIPFESRFQVARAARERDGTLYVLAVDRAGMALGSGAQPFSGSLFLDLEAPLAEVAPSPAPPTRSIGNDGLMGGIVFSVPIEERH
jgi:hypothetical protein